MCKEKWIMVLTSIIMVTLLGTGCSSSAGETIDTKVNTSPVQVDDGIHHDTAKHVAETVDKMAENTATIQKEIQTSNEKAVQTKQKANLFRTTSYLNMRKEPTTTSDIITTIPKGEEVHYISGKGIWYKVSYDSMVGYVSSEFLMNKSETEMGLSESPIVAEGYDIPILMYHAIDEYKGSGIKELFVTPENFESQMQYLKSAGFTPIAFDDLINIENIVKPILITLDDGYKNNMNAYNILKRLNTKAFQAKATIFMIGKKIDSKSGLSTEQIKEMSDSGIISIQSHTETHPSLPSIANYESELGDIKDKLEQITGKEITAISYPAGDYDAKVMEETEKYYEYAVTTKPGIASTSESLYEMKRIRINYSTTLAEFMNLVE